MVEPILKPNSFESLSKKLENLLQSAFVQIGCPPEITINPYNYSQKTPYDYVSPSGIRFFNSHKKEGLAFGEDSPRKLSQKAVETITQLPTFIKKLEVTEQGFVTIAISDEYLENMVDSLMKDGIVYRDPNPKKVLVDFSSPNIAKEMHVGHLRSTILGESVCRILEFNGHKVLRVNHLGDWGTQFGMLINYMKMEYPNFLEKMPDIADLTSFYKSAKEKFDKNPEFKKKSQETVVSLQSGDPECLNAWKIVCDVSKSYFRLIYQRLDVTLEDYGESFYNSRIPNTIQECEEKGLVTLSKGAKCIFLEKFDIPMMIVKSDGGYNYDTTDLAAIRYRLLELGVERVIYITDNGQNTHFLMLFEAAKKLGWLKPPQTSAEHVGFGVIQGNDGKRFKTRAGETVKLISLLDEAFLLAYKGLLSRQKENTEGKKTTIEDDEELKAAAESIGIAAIKYYDLKQYRLSDYKFEYEKMLDFKGNTAVYLLYSYVRLCSILKMSGLNEKDFKALSKQHFKISHPDERQLLMHVCRFPEIIDQVLKDIEIHKLCDFVYGLSSKISEVYSKYKILDKEHGQSRIMLCEVMRQTMELSLNLIGIKTISKI